MLNVDRLPLVSRIVFATFLCLEAATSWKNLLYIKALEYNASEPVAEWERRMAPLKAALPIARGFVGYVSDSAVACFDCANVDDQIEYTLTQYALAPMIVNKGTNYEWIVGNFGKGTFTAWVQSHPGNYKLVRFPYGIYLIHNQQQ
jgi:hypothetical protein